jgi:hypothetical protein
MKEKADHTALIILREIAAEIERDSWRALAESRGAVLDELEWRARR